MTIGRSLFTSVILTASLVASVATAVGAQRPSAESTRTAPAHPTASDETTFDFTDADIRGVITAIAEAGGLNVTSSDLPPKRVSLHARRPNTSQSAMALLRTVVQNSGLSMSEEGGFISITGSESPQTQQQDVDALARAVAAASGNGELKMHVYRLRHANATRMAQVLQAIFSGGGMPAGVTGITRPTLSQSLQQQRLTSGALPTGGLLGGGLGGGMLGGGMLGGGMLGGGMLGGGLGTPFGQGYGGGTFGQPGAPGYGAPQGVPQGVPQGGGARGNLPTIIIVPWESTNSLLIRATDRDWALVQQAIETVDLRPLQVLIEVVVAEVQRTNTRNVGVSVGASNQRTAKGNTTGSVALKGDTTEDFIARLTRYGAVDVNVALAALEARGNVRVLSRPLVFAENNMESSLLVGSQRPFIQSFRTFATATAATDQIVQYRDVGTSLTIIPTINAEGYVNLAVQQEVSSATNEIQFGAPVISTREATASLLVRDGQTVVVGGLADTQEQTIRSGIPGLSTLPGIGGLFRSSRKESQQTELFLFLTPHIVQSDSDVVRIREEIRRKSEMLQGVPVGPIVTTPSGPPPADTTGGVVVPSTPPEGPPAPPAPSPMAPTPVGPLRPVPPSNQRAPNPGDQ